MSTLQSIVDRIDGYRDECIRLQEELTSRPALGPDNGGSGEHEKAAYLRNLLASLDPQTLEEIRAPDPRAQGGYRPNLVALWKGPEGRAPVWVLSHMDIVPPGIRPCGKQTLLPPGWRGTGSTGGAWRTTSTGS